MMVMLLPQNVAALRKRSRCAKPLAFSASAISITHREFVVKLVDDANPP